MLVRSLHRSLVAFFAHFLGLLNESAATATATLVAARPPAHEADIVYVGNSSIGPVSAAAVARPLLHHSHCLCQFPIAVRRRAARRISASFANPIWMDSKVRAMLAEQRSRKKELQSGAKGSKY